LRTPLAPEARWENDLSIAPIGLTNSKFDQLGLYPNRLAYYIMVLITMVKSFVVQVQGNPPI
jgi:hypothetical protein